MKFRTEIGNIDSSFKIGHGERVVLIGSCFADNIGSKLVDSGFEAVHNPLGPLFNPASIARVIRRGLKEYSSADFITDNNGVWHCLDFANRYQASSAAELADKVNTDYIPFAQRIIDADVLIITFGTNGIFEYSQGVAGNCHKLPGTMFSRRYMTVDEICELWQGLIPPSVRVIFTLSPVRYPGDGLPQSFLSKATLRLAIDKICLTCGYDYFPAYEILNDDLRDYRFYATDLKHPSEMAIDYIYEKFADTYFTKDTISKAEEYRKKAIFAAHRPNL